MKHALIIVSTACALALASSAWADPFNDANDGKWDASDFDTWGAGAGVYPDAGDTATIDSNIVTVASNVTGALAPDLITVATGGTLYHYPTGTTYDIDSPLTLSGGTIKADERNAHFDFNGNVTAQAGTNTTLDTNYLSSNPADAFGRCSIEFFGALSGSGGLTKEGFNIVYLYETAAYTGTITVNEGRIAIQATATPAGAAPTVIINDGGQVYTARKTITDWNFQISDGGGLWWQANANEHVYVTGGTAQLSGTVTFTVQTGGAGKGHYDGDISGGGTLRFESVQADDAEHYLGGDNSGYSGTIQIDADRRLCAAHVNALGTGTTTIGVDGRLDAGVDLNAGYVLAQGGLVGNNSGDRTLGSGLTVELTAAGGGLFVSGNNKTFTVGALLTGDGALVADGTGSGNKILVTNTSNDYAGGTQVNFSPGASGQLVIAEAGALSDGTVQILNNRLVTEPANPADSVLTGLPAVEAVGGILELKSTEDNGNIHIKRGGGLIVTDGSTTLDYDSNIFVHTDAILADDLASFPTAGQIVGGGKIYAGLNGDLGSGDTYTVAGAFKGLATLDNNPTIAGTVAEAAGAGISFYRQNSRTITLDSATLNTTGPVTLDGGGPEGEFIVQGDNFAGTADTLQMEAEGPVTITGTDGLPAGATLNVNNGYAQASINDAINNSATVSVNAGGLWNADRSVTTGLIHINAGGGLWTDRDDIFAITSIAQGAKVALANDFAANLPTDGSVDFILLWRDYDGFDQGLVLSENRRITSAKDATEPRLASPTVISTVSTSEIGGRIAAGPYTLSIGAGTFKCEAQIDFAGKTLIIGDSEMYECIDIVGGVSWLGGASVDGNGMEMISQNENTVWLRNTSSAIGKIWVQGGTMRTDAEATLGGASEVRLDANTVWYTESSPTATMIIAGEGTLRGKDGGRVFSTQPSAGDDAGLAPGAADHGVGILHIDNGRMRFYSTGLYYSKLWIDVVADGGLAGTDHDQFDSATREVLNAENAVVSVYLPLPSPELNPNTLAGVDMTVLTASSVGAFHGAEMNSEADSHWALDAPNAVDTVNGTDVILHGSAISWTAIPGDADLDGSVLLSDLSILAFNWEEDTGMTWLTADFDFNGVVNLADLSELAFHWEETEAGAPPVPEPMTLGLLLAGAAAVIRRRRR